MMSILYRGFGEKAVNTRQVLPVSLWSPIHLTHSLLPMLTVLRRHGLDAEPMLERAGIERFGLMDPKYTISIDQELAFLQKVFVALSEPAMSMEIAREYRLRGFSVLGLAMQASASPLEMLRLMMRYPRLAWGMFDGYLQWDSDLVRVGFSPQPRLGAMEGFLAERDLACALVLFEEAMESRVSLQSLSFRHACSGDVSDYEAFFHCPVTFQAEKTELVCSLSVLTQPLPHAEPTMCAFYTAQCAAMSKEMDQPFSYKEAVSERLLSSAVVPDLESLAKAMFLTPRTLQRRLREEESAFSQLLRDTRMERAKQLLADTNQGMEQIASTLGFSDAVAFSHAFKSWVACSPRVWRERERTSAVSV